MEISGWRLIVVMSLALFGGVVLLGGFFLVFWIMATFGR